MMLESKTNRFDELARENKPFMLRELLMHATYRNISQHIATYGHTFIYLNDRDLMIVSYLQHLFMSNTM